MKPRIRRILVPVDFSAPSCRALDYATALAGNLGASINLVHVLPDPPLSQSAWELYVPESPEVREQRYRDASARLADLAAVCTEWGGHVTTEVRLGSPTGEIEAAAIDYGSDLIVMSTHGRTGLPHLLLGSIAERLLRTAPCPVLMVRQSLVPEDADAMAPEVAIAG